MKCALPRWIFAILLTTCVVSHAETIEPKGLGDPGKATALTIQASGTSEADVNQSATLVGPEAQLQLVVTATFDSGQKRDQTHHSDIQYQATPNDVVSITTTGLVRPLKNGDAVITISSAGFKTTLPVTVTHFDNPPSINFSNQIVPIFTKLGCNGGGCHGKSGGQNGFAMSLLGFVPEDDYRYLVSESRGRRLFPGSPERSLLLGKINGSAPHGGGIRLKESDPDYRILERWITQGMPYGNEDDPALESVSVYPKERMLNPKGSQQLKVIATFSDGTITDITRQAQYKPNNEEMAETDDFGRVTMLGKAGSVAIMVRYQGHVATFRATVPLGAPIENVPSERNFIDRFVFERLWELGLPPSQVTDDASFLRRVSLDITGRLPTYEESKAFTEDKSADKRDKVIDRLLQSPDYSAYFAQKWGSILRNRVDREIPRYTNFLFSDWLRTQFLANRPYDKLVSELITASGTIHRNPAVNWYRHVTTTNERVEDFAQIFLGVRIQCARCHHHPFEKWSEDDYWSLAAYFSKMKVKTGGKLKDWYLYSARQAATVRNERTQATLTPATLGGEPGTFTLDEDPRHELVGWLREKDNPFFARALVNRYWKHFLGRGIVEPEDDMRESNPPSNPELLDALAKHFVDSGYDLKTLIRTICQSSTYQLSALPNQYNQKDVQNYSRFSPRRLKAEVFLDAIDRFMGTTTQFTNLPQGFKATEIPDHGGVNNQFLNSFGRPAGGSACECERSDDVNMLQSLQLLNSRDILSKLSAGRAAALANDKERTDEAKITELTMRAFSRKPTPTELEAFKNHLADTQGGERVNAYQDIIWALVNTKEFMFNH